VTGSPGACGFSTYLGVLIEPGDRAKMRETECVSERERERYTHAHAHAHTHTETVKSFQMGL